MGRQPWFTGSICTVGQNLKSMIKFPKKVVKVFKPESQGTKNVYLEKASFENYVFMKVCTKLCINQKETTHSTKKTKQNKFNIALLHFVIVYIK